MTPGSRLTPQPSSPGGRPSTLPSHSGPAGFGLWSTGMRLRSLPLCLPRPLHCPTSPPRRQNNWQLNVQEVSRGPMASVSPVPSSTPGPAWRPGLLCGQPLLRWPLTGVTPEILRSGHSPRRSVRLRRSLDPTCTLPSVLTTPVGHQRLQGCPSPQRLSMETQKGLQHGESSPRHLVRHPLGHQRARRGCGFRRPHARWSFLNPHSPPSPLHLCCLGRKDRPAEMQLFLTLRVCGNFEMYRF